MVELMRGCKRCQQMPKFSSFGGMASGLSSYGVVCCSSVSGKTQAEAAAKWNYFNQVCDTVYQLNRETNQWEIYQSAKV